MRTFITFDTRKFPYVMSYDDNAALVCKTLSVLMHKHTSLCCQYSSQSNEALPGTGQYTRVSNGNLPFTLSPEKKKKKKKKKSAHDYDERFRINIH